MATLTLLRFEGDASVEAPDEWLLSADDDAAAAIVQALQRPPTGGGTVVSRVGLSRALATDPVALGTIGALAIGFVAAAIFAVIGFVLSAAVSARERFAEFALLRALGLSSGQLSVWLSLENALLAAFSLVSGSVLGLVIAWVGPALHHGHPGRGDALPAGRGRGPLDRWSGCSRPRPASSRSARPSPRSPGRCPRIGLGSVLRMSED